MPISSPGVKREDRFERRVATPAKGLTNCGLTRLLRPARSCRSSNSALPFHWGSTNSRMRDQTGGMRERDESLGSGGTWATHECRGRLAHLGWASAATDSKVLRCTRLSLGGVGYRTFMEHARGASHYNDTSSKDSTPAFDPKTG